MGKKPFTIMASMMLAGLILTGCNPGAQKTRNARSGKQQNWMNSPTGNAQIPPGGISQSHQRSPSGQQFPYPANGGGMPQHYGAPGAGSFDQTRGGAPHMSTGYPNTMGGSMPHSQTGMMPPPRAPMSSQSHGMAPPPNPYDQSQGGATSHRFSGRYPYQGTSPHYSSSRNGQF